MDHARAARTIADIIADANRAVCENVRDIIDEAGLCGTTDDMGDTAVGNYVAYQASLAAIAPLMVCYVGPAMHVMDAATNEVITTADTTGTLYDLHCLIGDAEPGFAHLHSEDPDPLGAADIAEAIATAPITADEAAYFERVTAELMADFA